LLAHSIPTGNSQLWLRANCPSLEINKHGCRKVLSWSVPWIVCT